MSTTPSVAIKARRRSRPHSGRTPSRQGEVHPLDRAMAELRNELARRPDDAALNARLGALHYRRGSLAQAESYYRRAVELQSMRPAFHNNLGNVLCDMGRMAEGIACYETAMAIEKAIAPGKGPSAEAEANLELARMEYRLIHERIEYLERVVQFDVHSAEALNALGAGYLLRNRREMAVAAFRKAIALDPRNPYAARNLAFAHTLDLESAGDLHGVLAELAESAMRFPHEPRLFLHQGELLEAAGLLEEAEEKFLRALKADPRCMEAYELLGRLRAGLGTAGVHDATAREVVMLLGKIERDAAAKRGRDGERAGAGPVFDLACVQAARARFAGAAAPDGDAVDGLLREALRLAMERKPAEATTAVNAAVLRAQMLEAEGRREEAALVLEELCEKLPHVGRPWFERGALALRQGDIALAVEAFERATLAEPQEAIAYHSLRFAFEGYRRYRSERVRFESAMRKDPRDAAAHHHLALASLSVLKEEEALFHFTRALELDARLAEAACGRARILQRRGHAEDALDAYRRALTIDPECAEARNAIALFAAQQRAH